MKVKVSIVIPNWNGRDLLEKNLPAVVKACQRWAGLTLKNKETGWEIIVVDDASSDESVKFIQGSYPQVKLVVNTQNLRFAMSCNRGVAASRGEVVVLLNNDVSPGIDFLISLVKHFEDEEIFAVGCKEGEVVSGKTVWSGRGEMFFERGLVLHRRADDQGKRITDWVTGGSGAFSRKKWLEIGGMDRLFRPAYEEDRDIAYRALKHGWKVLFEPQSVVYHHHETTNLKAFGPQKIMVFSFKNQFLFVWKNISDGSYLWRHFFWLPYHLTVTAWRSQGLLAVGFLQAIRQLPEALSARRKVKKYFKLRDKNLL